MIQIQDSNLYVGTDVDHAAVAGNPDWAIVNTAQNIHYGYNGWNWTDRKPSRLDPNYLLMRRGQLISANLVDTASRFYNMFGTSGFVQLLDFIDEWLPTKRVLVNCNRGESRSPSVALLSLAKRAKTISSNSYESAAADFVRIDPAYLPGGIAGFLSSNWSGIS
jgi:hypothetical protein